MRCTVHGSLEGLTVHEIPELIAGPGKVVVEVRAAAVSFADILVVQGAYRVAAPVPTTRSRSSRNCATGSRARGWSCAPAGSPGAHVPHASAGIAGRRQVGPECGARRYRLASGHDGPRPGAAAYAASITAHGSRGP
ncbi:hypothetical protein GCM10009527_077560 [Actinomadura nitritigenes]|uniref:Alcohol dehydrogenase N-terminal domain-containing protein n=1 Tax=Actinomadura nitritigenes TaxID=134602 RepID=A0ABS3R2R5_9ACTN|nr:hypothetical protein [Actinomadura nitritigenes]MBO2440539.1 hypothetical protein [Actinomadura nitritigenes]